MYILNWYYYIIKSLDEIIIGDYHTSVVVFKFPKGEENVCKY